MDKKSKEEKRIEVEAKIEKKQVEEKIEDKKPYAFRDLSSEAQYDAMQLYREYCNIPVEVASDTFLRNRMLSDLDTHFTKEGYILALLNEEK